MNRRYLAGLAGLLWLAIAFAFLMAMLLAAALASPAFVILAALGVAALGQAAALFARPPSRTLFLASSILGFGVAVLGMLAGLESRGAVLSAGPIMAVVAVSVAAAVISVFGARNMR
jgi:hypothetical protein